jgi:hypothetical protein
MTTIVNVRVAYLRPQYQNLREWCENPNNVYIGRKGVVFIEGVRYPPQNSPWSNPFKLSASVTREQCIEKYREYIIHKIQTDNLVNELLTLKNKNLGCWCAPEPCHGDVLKELIDEYSFAI